MGDTPKQEWAERMADRIAVAIGRLARAHALGDEELVDTERAKLWIELKAMIFALDVSNHVKPD